MLPISKNIEHKYISETYKVDKQIINVNIYTLFMYLRSYKNSVG